MKNRRHPSVTTVVLKKREATRAPRSARNYFVHIVVVRSAWHAQLSSVQPPFFASVRHASTFAAAIFVGS